MNHQLVCNCVRGGLRRFVKEFQASCFQFINEASLRAAAYGCLYRDLEDRGLLHVDALPYKKWGSRVPVAVIQCEAPLGPRRNAPRLDIAVPAFGTAGVYCCQAGTMRYLIGIEFKHRVPENRKLDSRKILEYKKDDHLLTELLKEDWTKLRNRKVQHKIALAFVATDQQLSSKGFEDLLESAPDISPDAIEFGHPYIVTRRTVIEITPR